MTDPGKLHHLSTRAGIEPHYWDIWGNFYGTSDETKVAILGALGFPASDDAAADASLVALDDAEWREPLPPVIVVREGEPVHIPMALPSELADGAVACEVVEENGRRHAFEFRAAELPFEANRTVDGRVLDRRWFHLPTSLPLGYHTLTLHGLSNRSMKLIVAPHRCYLPGALANGGRRWGIATHLYTVRTGRNWGIGDFTDLCALVDLGAKLGAASIGLNPLHALFLHSPQEASPYSPNSRVFLNPIYIDVEAVPDYAECAEAQALVASMQTEIARLRRKPVIEYRTVSALKQEVLEAMHASFRARHAADPEDARTADFARFRERCGERLRRFALFEAISESQGPKPWSKWPKGLRDPSSPEAAAFAEAHRDRLDYFEYLQWQADAQLGAAQDRAREAGLSIGLYQDVAVGADPKGADAWGEQAVTVIGGRVGAPPDPFNMLGQDWGTPPMHPMRLRNTAYEPFVAMLRANMRHAGAIRIDHAMGLKHLFWIPEGSLPTGGAYVEYPFEDLLGILALESHRNACLVIGEDLGTVPEGFRERMESLDVLSYRVLYFEKMGDRFKSPGEYPARALACVSTHDLATLKGFWEGADLAIKKALSLYPSPEAEAGDAAARSTDRRLLLHAVAGAGLLPEGVDPEAADDTPLSDPLCVAVHGYLAASPANLVMVQIDDLAGEGEQINLPGTVDERPNWRRRLTPALTTLAEAPLTRAIAGAMGDRAEGGPLSETG